MSNQIYAGIDIHKDFLVVSVLRGEDNYLTKKYDTDYQSLIHLKRWLARLKVTQIAIESTGIYMVQCVELLRDRFEITQVHPNQTKHIPGKKTDAIDSKWLATLLSKNLLKKSHIPNRMWREIRELVRQRIAQTQTKTRAKNRLHKVLVQEGYYLDRAFSDIYGATCQKFIRGLAEGKTLAEVVELNSTSKYVVRALSNICKYNPMKRRLTPSVCFIIKIILNEIEQCENRIDLLEEQVLYQTQVEAQGAEQLRILMSVPGISEKSAKAILSETGDISRFSTGKHYVSYAGLAPGTHESGGKKKKSSITKCGNKYLRTSYVEAAHIAGRSRQSRLKPYFTRLKKRIGYKKAVVALAAKMMRIVHALLTKIEIYEESNFRKDEKLLYLPHAKQVFSLKELDTLLRGKGLKIAVRRA